MDREQWSKVDDYIADLFIGEDLALEAALGDSRAAGLPAIQVTPPMGKFLHLLARIRGARRILEVGTLGGYSTIWLARALPPDGRLISLELRPERAELARANLSRAGVGDLVEVRVGPAVESMAALIASAEGVAGGGEPFDLIFIDADKESNPEYFRRAMQLTRPGSVIVIDNVVRDGTVIDAGSRDSAVIGTRQLNELMAAEPRVSVTQLQTVSGKRWDGFALAVVLR